MTTTIYWTPTTDAYPPPQSPVLAACGQSVYVGIVEWNHETELWEDYFDSAGPGVRQDFTHWALLSGLLATEMT